MSKRPKDSVAACAQRVRDWPRYLRCHTSAYKESDPMPTHKTASQRCDERYYPPVGPRRRCTRPKGHVGPHAAAQILRTDKTDSAPESGRDPLA